MAGTFLFYDFETDGVEPAACRPTQFACIRTDSELNPVDGPEGEGLNFWCRPARDHLPAGMATLVTGMSPQRIERQAPLLTEREFFGRIHALFNTPGTTSLGWNSLRFDDLIARFGFWRTFLDPYTHTWSGGCRVWDLLDLSRAYWALRPDGITWVHDEHGDPVFKLDRLAPANDIEHDDAHDALGDVRATIGMARRLRAAQPRLWDRAQRLTDKRHVMTMLESGTPLIHTTTRFSAEGGHTSLVHVVGRNPVNDKEFIAWDLRQDPSELIEADVETIRNRTFVSADDLPDGVERFRLKGVKCNRAPFVEADLRVLDADAAGRLGIDVNQCLAHHHRLTTDPEASDLGERVATAWNRPFDAGSRDADDAIYDGFIEGADKRLAGEVPGADADGLCAMQNRFTEVRLNDLLLHYRARNWPESLDDAETRRWHARCRDRIENPVGRRELPWPEWVTSVEFLKDDAERTENERALLSELLEWGHTLHG